jgi:hypothetical protein
MMSDPRAGTARENIAASNSVLVIVRHTLPFQPPSVGATGRERAVMLHETRADLRALCVSWIDTWAVCINCAQASTEI